MVSMYIRLCKCSPSVPLSLQLNVEHFHSNIPLDYKEYSSLTTSFSGSPRNSELQEGILEQLLYLWANQWQEDCEVVWSPGNLWLQHQSKWLMPYNAPKKFSHFCLSTQPLLLLDFLCSLWNVYIFFVGFKTVLRKKTFFKKAWDFCNYAA